MENVLFKKSVVDPYLRCFNDDETKILLNVNQERECGNHTGAGHSSPIYWGEDIIDEEICNGIFLKMWCMRKT